MKTLELKTNPSNPTIIKDKKIKVRSIALLIFAFIFARGYAQQNIQIMQSFEGYPVITLEHFSQDKYGTTYFFTDFELNELKGSPSLSLTKIMRTFTIKNQWSAHIEYNGGLFLSPAFSAPISNAYLIGVDYFIHSKDFSKTLNLKANYKYISIPSEFTFQFSGIWNVHLLDNKLSLLGFAHYWRESGSNIFYAEPQIWHNLTKAISLGGEVKTSFNFNTEGFKATPLIGIKFTL
jgi:hypothetical protein